MVSIVLYGLPVLIVAMTIIVLWYKGKIETFGELLLWVFGMVIPVINILISMFVWLYLMDVNRKFLDSVININIKRKLKETKEEQNTDK